MLRAALGRAGVACRRPAHVLEAAAVTDRGARSRSAGRSSSSSCSSSSGSSRPKRGLSPARGVGTPASAAGAAGAARDSTMCAPRESAHAWLEAWHQDPARLDGMTADDVILHTDGMWLGQSLHGPKELQHAARRAADAVPDYEWRLLDAAASERGPDGSYSQFALWKGTGTNTRAQSPGAASSGKRFEHYGMERHRKNAADQTTDIFCYCGPTRDQAEHLLLDPELPFNDEVWEPMPELTEQEQGPPLTDSRKAAMDECMYKMLKELAGPGDNPATLAELQEFLAPDFVYQEGTRVWTSHNMHRIVGLAELSEHLASMTNRFQADEGYPKILAKAHSVDGHRMFVHSECVFHDLRCGVRHVAHSMHLVFFFNNPNGEPRIDRAICMRGAETEAERAHFFDVLHRKHGGGPEHRRKSGAEAGGPAAHA